MPGTLTPLYCTPQDVYDQSGIDPTQLRLDDNNLASGQTVATTSAAAIGATSLAVSALQYPLLTGTVLVFDQAGMTSPVETTLTAVAAIGATSLTVGAIATAIPSGAQAIDNGVNIWLGSLLSKGCKYATDTVNNYLTGRYDTGQLVNSWSVNRWATAIAVRWVAKRCYRAPPQGAEEDYLDAIKDLQAVKANQLDVSGAATRTSGWPFMSNITLDDRFTYRKLRVETVISEGTPTQFAQSVDWGSFYSIEW